MSRPGAWEKTCAVLPDEAVSCRLDRLGRIHRGMMASALDQIGLYGGQEIVLASLWQHGPLTQTRLSALVGVDTSTMSRSLQRLERAGYVERCPGPVDKRTTVVAATAAGHLLRDKVAAIYDQTEQRLVGSLSPDERRQLAALCQKVIDAVEPECTEELARRSAVFFPDSSAAAAPNH